MKKVKIIALKKVEHTDLIEKYEIKNDHYCNMELGRAFISIDGLKPEGFCESAWMNLYPYVFALANGAKDFYTGWMKNPNQAMISCNDGFRPVSFLLEVID